MNSATKDNASEHLNLEIKIPKKRSRKPKNTNSEILEPKIPKKRGRKPKIKTGEPEVKIPKKRGRKPNSLINNESKILQENKYLKDNVLHLKIDTEKINNENIENVYNYSPLINNPVPYQPEASEIFKSSNFQLNNKEEIVSENNI